MRTLELPILNGPSFRSRFSRELRAAPSITTLQINIGYVCNLACRHCHVESSPARNGSLDNMSEATARRVAEWACAQEGLRTVDFTGGSPEMNPNFRWMVTAFRQRGFTIMDRCNPTIIPWVDRRSGESFEWVPQFLADHQVHVVASMPCYLEDNVERQRGRGSYDASVEGLRRLNDVGYGSRSDLRLTLVYNPNGPHLPPPQRDLAADYTRELRSRFGLVFDELWTITNMPIKRWRHELERAGRLGEYMQLLIRSFNESTVEHLMCRHMVSIDPQGRVYDCDFNQAIGMPIQGSHGRSLWDYTASELADRIIATDDHCYGCTAGSGSSCGGSLA